MEYYRAVLLAVGLWSVGVCGQVFPTPAVLPNNPSARYAQILKELSEVTQGRQALAVRLQQYRETFDSLQQQAKLKKQNCACYNTSTIAFNAHLSKDVATLGKDQPVPYDNVTLNSGGGYDKRHSQFRAPVSGLYQFFVSLATNAGYKLAAEVLLNNAVVVKIRTGNANQVNTGANEFVIHMAAGDDLWVQHSHNITDSNRLFYAEGLFTTFSGYLVARD